jgi:hypothetical protein
VLRKCWAPNDRFAADDRRQDLVAVVPDREVGALAASIVPHSRSMPSSSAGRSVALTIARSNGIDAYDMRLRTARSACSALPAIVPSSARTTPPSMR